MQSATLTIGNPTGLHARAASLFVQTAASFQSKITAQKGNKIVDAKSILKILSLGAKLGASITVTAEGPDEETAISALASLVNSNFGE
jgi:phosphocarrier protein